ncbi:MAG: hypothetical protein GXP16_18715 [Gammaproteobacteria bacterium]|nr:hypothetical protein [Gammaproteobacteria bacterium]
MKIFVLGGSGTMGRRAVKHLEALDVASQIIVADINKERAEAVADLYGPHVSSVAIDVLDQSALHSLLSDADVVLNTTGPFYKFGVPVLKAAITARCNYFDINDDWEPTLEMLEYDAAARKAGIIAVTMGGSPGMTNMLAQMAIEKLDEIDQVYLCVNTDSVTVDTDDLPDGTAHGVATAAAVHTVHQLSGRVMFRKSGEFVEEAPLQQIKFDDLGSGVTSGYVVGHPEPITLATTYPQIQDCACLVFGNEDEIAQMSELMRAVDSGNISPDEAAVMLEESFSGNTVDLECADSDASKAILPLLYVYAKGKKSKKDAYIGLKLKGLPGTGMADMTSIPLVVAVSLFIQGKVQKKGFLPPEVAYDATEFFDALAPYTVPACKNAADLIVIDSVD